jgi:hypothetical protein
LGALKLGYFVGSMAGLYEQLADLKKDPSARNLAASASSVLSTADSALSAMRGSWSMKSYFEETQGLARGYRYREIAGSRVPPAYAKWRRLGAWASCIDIALNLHDAATAKGECKRAGYAIRALGAAMALVGSISAETGVGVILALLGMGVQWIGDKVMEMGSEMNDYLRTCPWGLTPAETDSIASLNQRLDYLMHGFEWDVEVKPEQDTGNQIVWLVLCTNKAWPVPAPDLEMDLSVSVEHTQNLWPPVQVSMKLGFEDLYQAETCAIKLATPPRTDGPAAPWMKSNNDIVVKGNLSMLVNRKEARRLEAKVYRECALLPMYSVGRRDPGVV